MKIHTSEQPAEYTTKHAQKTEIGVKISIVNSVKTRSR
jgi:hypothetical protein